MDRPTSTVTTQLLVIRHGQSTWNEEKRWQGQADPPLSDFGRQQAFAAAQSVGQVDVIVSSPQLRAAETAGIIAEHIGVGPVQVLDGLQERCAGIWSGLTRDEIDERWPGWVEDGRRPEGWEPDEVFIPRVLEAIGRVAQEFAGSSALVVCHGGVIIAIENELGVNEARIPNLHGRVVHWIGGELVGRERLELIPEDMRTGGTGGRDGGGETNGDATRI